MKFFDSFEAEELKKLISDKKLYLAKIENKFQYQIVQKEIQLLEKLLPIIQQNTNVIHSEIAKYAVKAFDAALKYNCNGMLMYFHIHDNYVEKPRVGVANTHSLDRYGSVGAIDVIVDNMDGNGVKVEPFNLRITDELL